MKKLFLLIFLSFNTLKLNAGGTPKSLSSPTQVLDWMHKSRIHRAQKLRKIRPVAQNTTWLSYTSDGFDMRIEANINKIFKEALETIDPPLSIIPNITDAEELKGVFALYWDTAFNIPNYEDYIKIAYPNNTIGLGRIDHSVTLKAAKRIFVRDLTKEQMDSTIALVDELATSSDFLPWQRTFLSYLVEKLTKRKKTLLKSSYKIKNTDTMPETHIAKKRKITQETHSDSDTEAEEISPDKK